VQLGVASVPLLILMIPVGFHVVLVKAAAGLKSVDEAGFNLAQLTLGFAFAFAGLASRKRPVVHKRLMLFATLMLTVAAADRVALVLGLEEVRLFRKLLAVTPAVALVGYDSLLPRRIPMTSTALWRFRTMGRQWSLRIGSPRDCGTPALARCDLSSMAPRSDPSFRSVATTAAGTIASYRPMIAPHSPATAKRRKPRRRPRAISGVDPEPQDRAVGAFRVA
jgi:hypothetical protein